jgi:hypothetical protein
VVPYVSVITEEDSSREGKYSGLGVNAAFQKEGEKTCLQLQFTNRSLIAFGVRLRLVRNSR